MSSGRLLQAGAALAGLVLVYALALGSFKLADLALGAALGGLVLVAFGRFVLALAAPDPGELIRRATGLPLFALVLAREVLVGTARVALAVLRRDPAGVSGVVAVPMGDRTARGVVVSGLAISLTPGELVVDLDWERRVMLVHALDASDPDGLREAQHRLYERYQRRVFP